MYALDALALVTAAVLFCLSRWCSSKDGPIRTAVRLDIQRGKASRLNLVIYSFTIVVSLFFVVFVPFALVDAGLLHDFRRPVVHTRSPNARSLPAGIYSGWALNLIVLGFYGFFVVTLATLFSAVKSGLKSRQR